MKLIYIAGAFDGKTDLDIESNIVAAENLAAEVIEKTGHGVICPHSMGRNFKHGPGDREYWFASTLAMMERCDAVIFRDGWRLSEVAKMEADRAGSIGLPVFDDVEILANYNFTSRGFLMDEYQLGTLRTADFSGYQDDSRALAVLAVLGLGLAGESGEVVDHIKKFAGHGHKLDRNKIKDELGDVLWYVSVISDFIGARLSEVASGNINKLKNRYPEGFSHERSKNRE